MELKKGKINILIGEKARKLQKSMLLPQQNQDSTLPQIIKGMPASPGYVTGKVKLILTNAEAGEFKDGDILVTIMTVPDLVPIMKKSKAIVTDEGGMTCHAAIVSRELKIPCIVGTKIATKVLKNGEEIEVDANKGTIKRLKP